MGFDAEGSVRGSGAAFTCDASGRVLTVIDDRLGLAHGVRVGSSLLDLVESSSVQKLHGFLAELERSGTAYDWELNLSLRGSIKAYLCAGARFGGAYLVVIAGSRSALEPMLAEFIAINSELVNTVRVLQKRVSLSIRSDPEPGSFGDLSRLNNDLVNLQRELAKRNAELTKSEAFVQCVIDTAIDVLYVYDLGHESYTFMNDGFERMLGHSPSSSPGSHLDPSWSIVHPEDAGLFFGRVQRLIGAEDGEVIESDSRMISAAAGWRWVRLRESVLERGIDGRPDRVVGAAGDVTQLKAATRTVHLQTTDEITGLYDRASLLEIAEPFVTGGARRQSTCGVLVVRIDGLQGTIDDKGAPVADAMLQEAARLLRSVAGFSDILARVGPDEFVILSPGVPDSERSHVLRDEVYAAVGVRNDSARSVPRLVLSTGIAVAGPSSCDVGALIAQAEESVGTDRQPGNTEP